jgi:hypothetical protein
MKKAKEDAENGSLNVLEITNPMNASTSSSSSSTIEAATTINDLSQLGNTEDMETFLYSLNIS